MAIGDVTSGLSTSGGIYFTGLGSGTDFDSLISQLVAVEQARVTTYQTWQTTWENKKTAMQELNTAMLSLRTSLQDMDSVNEFLQKSATASDTDVLTATASGAADTGTYTYSVSQLAQNKVMVTASGFSALTSTVNSTGSTTSFVYTYNGETISNAVPAGASLRDLVNIINADSANTGVRASTIYDGSNYYLQLKGLDTGEAYDLAISSNTTLSGFDASAFNTTQENQDAKFKINGWPLSNAYISRDSNTVTDVIDGITLSLKGTGSGTITVETDVDAVVENVQDFVDQVNTVKELLQELTEYDSTTETGSILTGNYGLQMIETMLDNITAAAGLGFSADRDSIISLGSVGVTTDTVEGSETFGMLVLDSDLLESMLTSNAYAVGKLFAAQYVGDTDSADINYTSYVDGITKAGTYDVTYTVQGGQIVAASIDGRAANITSNSSTITGQYGTDAAGMVLTVGNMNDGVYKHTVNLRLGKAGEMVDQLADLTNSTTGPLAILEDNYSTISDNIQTKIDNETLRIARMETRLRDQYSRLDTLLGQYDQLQSSLESQLAQLE
ncbi:Flagellar hook-associated protein 2 [Fundidesulfovibrio magnetotacticus]|uniref:Flagellar hook-associated protein 2 n=1 Tax=Fundidesulfovibrio magnetotacticus TaxID=2730080 RepID=A0A6V8LX40_9BACT|nr:flagellar filament capping protein FliD [Fundidesulfovibrio magnetotacticus]GFK94366.1 Flagellar hook-associated protein 2 [Fundidesulfovibrio magnetotacticus]